MRGPSFCNSVALFTCPLANLVLQYMSSMIVYWLKMHLHLSIENPISSSLLRLIKNISMWKKIETNVVTFVNEFS